MKILTIIKALKSLRDLFDPSIEGQPYVVNHSRFRKKQSFLTNSVYGQNINRQLNFK